MWETKKLHVKGKKRDNTDTEKKLVFDRQIEREKKKKRIEKSN